MNKKSQAGLTAIVIIIIALVFLGWLVKIGSRECNSNKDCEENQYCGSDFACHKIPIIEKTSTIVKRSYTAPVLIVCLTIIILAIIWKWETIFRKRETTEEIETPKEKEPYYSSQFQYSAK